MKKIFLIWMALNSFTALGNPLGGNPTDGYCQTVDGSACGWGGKGSSQRNVINIPTRWGAIYYNAANRAIGISENNTEGYRSANKEALENCIKAGGGKNPISRKGQGCHMVTEYRNSCAAIAVGGEIGKGRVAGIGGHDYVEGAEKEAIEVCERGKPFKCEIKYSGCSRHPDYLRY